MEKASLHRLTQLEERPSEKVWEQISASEEKQILLNMLAWTEETPSKSVWARIQKRISGAKAKRMRTASLMAIALLVMLLYGVPFLKKTPESIDPINPKLATIQTPQRDEWNASTGRTNTNESIEKASWELQAKNPERNLFEPVSIPKQNPTYVWVATKNGEPIRLSQRWENLSCCLSGEQESMECDEQRTQWHSELMETDLGFQADPLIGLLALMQKTSGND